MLFIKKIYGLIAIMAALMSFGCTDRATTIPSGNLKIEVDGNLKTRISSGYEKSGPLVKEFQQSEMLETKHFATADFRLESRDEEPFQDSIGKGVRYGFTGKFEKGQYSLEKHLLIVVYEDFPDMAFFHVTYSNASDRDIEVRRWINHRMKLSSAGDQPPFWSFQGGTTNARKDWILPVDKGFSQENYLGMTSSDYGGGIPVTDIWRKDAGLAIGHTELIPKEVSLPVDMDEYSEDVQMGIEFKFTYPVILKKGETLQTCETFVMTHPKDYFTVLQQFTRFMKSKGLKFTETEPDAYEPMWCAWGYERNFTLDEIIGTLPKVKEMGIKWAGLDDGYQIAEGDWHLDPVKFPHGDQDMRRLVDHIHAHGMKAMIWWAPLAADPGSRILREDPDVLLFNEDWSPRYITWWDSWLMSPAYEGTWRHTREVLDMFLKTWDFDGIKIDGQHVNMVPADHHPDHGLADPQDCIARLPEFFKMVIEYCREIKPDAVVEICPCGCCISYYLTPYLNQAVSSDPTSSWQVRLKGKTYKAIIGPTAYYGDHVELIDSLDGFATQMGIGAVMGTKFTWPRDNPQASRSFLLTEAKEQEWKNWFGLYNRKMLPAGNYLGKLYDIGYDIPEAHVIAKGDTLYYAFYNPDWKGRIELRGLKAGTKYSVRDYVHNIDFGAVRPEDPWIDAGFRKYLLLEVIPM